jgi:uncharacterized membrane protein
VFDSALWTTASGGPLAYVPLYGHSLFVQHFMPTLLLLAPLTRMFDSPTYLIIVQTLFYAAAALLLYQFAIDHVPRSVAIALTTAFLLSRRSHSAVTSYFYIESAEPLLILGAVLAWSKRRMVLYWILVVLALGCKEDVAIYLGSFGLLLATTRRALRTGIATMSVAAIWLIGAMGVAIPQQRAAYHVSHSFIQDRYGVSPEIHIDVASVVQRMAAARLVNKLVTVTSATGFLCLLSPLWMAIAVPGMLLGPHANGPGKSTVPGISGLSPRDST